MTSNQDMAVVVVVVPEILVVVVVVVLLVLDGIQHRHHHRMVTTRSRRHSSVPLNKVDSVVVVSIAAEDGHIQDFGCRFQLLLLLLQTTAHLSEVAVNSFHEQHRL